jgi:hypothetical protein
VLIEKILIYFLLIIRRLLHQTGRRKGGAGKVALLQREPLRLLCSHQSGSAQQWI